MPECITVTRVQRARAHQNWAHCHHAPDPHTSPGRIPPCSCQGDVTCSNPGQHVLDRSHTREPWGHSAARRPARDSARQAVQEGVETGCRGAWGLPRGCPKAPQSPPPPWRSLQTQKAGLSCQPAVTLSYLRLRAPPAIWSRRHSCAVMFELNAAPGRLG